MIIGKDAPLGPSCVKVGFFIYEKLITSYYMYSDKPPPQKKKITQATSCNNLFSLTIPQIVKSQKVVIFEEK